MGNLTALKLKPNWAMRHVRNITLLDDDLMPHARDAHEMRFLAVTHRRADRRAPSSRPPHLDVGPQSQQRVRRRKDINRHQLLLRSTSVTHFSLSLHLATSSARQQSSLKFDINALHPLASVCDPQASCQVLAAEVLACFDKSPSKPIPPTRRISEHTPQNFTVRALTDFLLLVEKLIAVEQLREQGLVYHVRHQRTRRQMSAPCQISSIIYASICQQPRSHIFWTALFGSLPNLTCTWICVALHTP